jgi:phytanoyl-CoA hydroxylase
VNPRHTFQLHLVEGPLQGFTWSESNWLQYPPGVSFQSIRKSYS